MKILLLSTSAYDDTGQFGNQFACAAIEVTPRLVDLCQRRGALIKAAQAKDRSLAQICFQDDAGPEFLDDGFLLACQKESDEFHDDFVNNDSAVLPEGMALEGHQPATVEARQTVFRPKVQPAGGFEIAWSALDPATGQRVLTQAVPLDYLEELLEAGLDPDCCDCERPGQFFSGVPGIIAHMENGRLAKGAAVERCDQCERYPSDAAALARLRELGIA